MADPIEHRVHVPDGAPVAEALARTTDLAVVAHPDDLELVAPGIIGACRDDPARWFTGVVCTDGAGSVPPADGGPAGPAALAERRAAEQRAAADLGRYAAVALLGHGSATVAQPGARGVVVDEVAALLARTRPGLVLTHDLADRHTTHLGTALAVVDAIRRLPTADRPTRLVGCEGWRSADWLGAADLVRLDVTGHEDLAGDLLACFGSQLGPKAYEPAAAGRRRANATFDDPRAPGRRRARPGRPADRRHRPLRLRGRRPAPGPRPPRGAAVTAGPPSLRPAGAA